MFAWYIGIFVYPIIITLICALVGKLMNNYLDDDIAAEIFSFSLAIMMIVYALGYFYSFDKVTTTILKKYDTTTNIYSLSDNITTQGRFTLGTGSVDSKIKYYTLVGDSSNGYLIKSFDGDTTYVVPENIDKAYIVEKYEQVHYQYKRTFIVGIMFKPLKDSTKDNLVKREIHVPQNYVSQQYNIDLK